MLTIIFALGHDLAGSSQRSLVFVFFEHFIVVDDTLDERLLEICEPICQ